MRFTQATPTDRMGDCPRTLQEFEARLSTEDGCREYLYSIAVAGRVSVSTLRVWQVVAIRCSRIPDTLIRRIVRSVTPAISAASSQLIFFAIAFRITSCSFVVRSIAAALTDPGFIKPQHRRHFVKSGQITCELNRTFHILATPIFA